LWRIGRQLLGEDRRLPSCPVSQSAKIQLSCYRSGRQLKGCAAIFWTAPITELALGTTRAKSFVRSAALSCATRRLSARRSSSLPPRRLRQAQVRALVRKLVLEQKKPDHKLCRNPGRPLSLYSGAISPSMKSQSILPYVDDLVQPRAEQITRSC